MSQKSLEKMFKNSKDKKLSHLWKKVSKIDKYLEYSSSRQLFYISVMSSNSKNSSILFFSTSGLRSAIICFFLI